MWTRVLFCVVALSICSDIKKYIMEKLYLLGMELGEFKLISLNVRGLSNFKKRKSILTWYRKQKVDIVLSAGDTLDHTERKIMES